MYEGGKKVKTCKEIAKRIQERSLSAYIYCEQTVQLEQRGMHRIWGIDPIAFLTPKTGASLDRRLPVARWAEDLALLPFYIAYRSPTVSPTG